MDKHMHTIKPYNSTCTLQLAIAKSSCRGASPESQQSQQGPQLAIQSILLLFLFCSCLLLAESSHHVFPHFFFPQLSYSSSFTLCTQLAYSQFSNCKFLLISRLTELLEKALSCHRHPFDYTCRLLQQHDATGLQSGLWVVNLHPFPQTFTSPPP